MEVWSGEMWLGTEDTAWVQYPSSLSSSLPFSLAWTSCARAVVSLCADEFFGGYVLQPPESKPNFTPLAILAHVLGAIQPYAHFIHVQRLIPHQVCCRVCLLFCCCRCSLIGLVLSSCSVQPPRQLCSLPSKPALAFWQARRSSSRRLQVKSRMMITLFLLIQSWSGIPASETKAGRDHLHEPAWHFSCPSEPFLQFLNLSVVPRVWGESASWKGSCLDCSLNQEALCTLEQDNFKGNSAETHAGLFSPHFYQVAAVNIYLWSWVFGHEYWHLDDETQTSWERDKYNTE